MKNTGSLSIYASFFKRPLDFLFALLATIILSPVLIVVAILVKYKLGSPILFKQKRPGLNEKIFTMYKFRTMTNETDENGELLDDSKRLTKFGKFLRATSLDELPELFNILKGEMSFVGPRPLLVEYLDLYNETQRKRHTVRPGLTGLAQINGRNAISWEEKFKLDIKYTERITFIGDCLILISTVKKVFLKEGIHSKTAATMEQFKGSKVDDNNEGN
ncbi:sugar transferase [Virgibacillus sp. 179-BFC.A HS]|uniref:Sugar transferase n=1 Tax=Tigheibacillus jepli TaxID=3035914 RepID=A0ABU5CFS7_9BACI|nr:sugar transferase [Virgibacillus sp. 179-BFC.A HS]MDY0404727.1 sugar transferase [Virgibacillus sp. 179-BFC.A HS]